MGMSVSGYKMSNLKRLAAGCLAIATLLLAFSPAVAAKNEPRDAQRMPHDSIASLLKAAKAHMAEANRLYLAHDPEGAKASAAKSEEKLLEALRSKGAADPKYGVLFADSGYRMTMRLHPANSGVEYVRTFSSEVICGEAGCQGVPSSVVMMFRYTNGSISTIRSHIVPLPGDQGEVNPFFLNVVTQYGFFKTKSGDVMMLYAANNWRGGGWRLALMNLSRNKRLEHYSVLFNKNDLPAALLKRWDDKQRAFVGLCDEGSNGCTANEAEQTALNGIDEAAGTIVIGKKMVKSSGAVTSGGGVDAERAKLIKLLSDVKAQGTFDRLTVHPGDDYSVAGPLLGKPLHSEGNLAAFESLTLIKNDIGQVKHIYLPPRAAGLADTTLAHLEKLLGVQAAQGKSGYSLGVVIRSSYGMNRLTFAASSLNGKLAVLALSGPLDAGARGVELD